MNIRARRILYISAIAAFLLAAPPLVLYTAGWRYDFTYNRLVATGSLVIKSNPAKADIVLNGQPRSATTPAIINDILPGKINLAVTKANHYPWQRTIAIAPRVTTFVENIKLFLKSSPQPLLPAAVRQYWWNRKQDKVAYLTTTGAWRLYNTLNNKDSLLSSSPAIPLPAVVWSPHDDQILLYHQVIDANFPEKIINLADVFGQNFSHLKWDPAMPDTLYGLLAGALYRLPYRLPAARLVLPGPISDYQIEPERIAWLEKNQLAWINPADPNTIQRLPVRADAVNSVFIATNSRLFSLYNAAKKILLIADPAIVENLATTTNAIITIPNVQKAVWTHDGSRLVYTDGSAIYQRWFTSPLTVVPEERATQLITRYSEPITDIFWSDDELYLFYIIGTRLSVLEINPNFTPFSLELLNSAANLKQPEFVRNQQFINFIDAAGGLQFLAVAQKESGTFFFGN